MSVRPLGEFVVVEPIKESKTTQSGIVLPEYYESESLKKAKVIAVGSGRHTTDGVLIPLDVVVGDIVLFNGYSPNTFEENGKVRFIISQSFIYGVLS